MKDKILAAYASKYGSTQEVAEAIAEELRAGEDEVDLLPVRKVDTLDGYRAVVLGAPLYLGRWHGDMQRFLSQHQEVLARLPLAIFTLGPLGTDETEWEEVRSQLAGEIQKLPGLKPDAVQLFGGKFDPARLGFGDRLIAALPASPLHGHPASDGRDWNAIRQWARQLSHDLANSLVAELQPAFSQSGEEK